jgi:hypothetical protein
MGKTLLCGICLACVMAVTPADAQAPAPAEKSPTDKLISDLVDQLIKVQKPDGSWEHSGYEVGMTALAVLALKHSNLPQASTPIAKGIAYIEQHALEPKTYSAGMVISALYQVDYRAHRSTIDKYAALLCNGQVQTGESAGMYTYNLVDPKGKPLTGGDNSNTQFGVLGLFFAARAGYQVPRTVWESTKKHWVDTQNADGGWGYRPGANSYHNMSFAGAVSLYLAEEQLAAGVSSGCVMTPPSRATEAAMKWVGGHFTSDLDSYGLYALERLGILTGRSEFSGHDWYKESEAKVLGNEVRASSVNSGDAGTAFLILFLSRGKEPVVINKLQYYGDWDDCHYDCKHIADYMSDRMQTPVQWRVVTLDSKPQDLQKVPILHYDGIKGPQFTDDQKLKLRNYVLKGGVLMAQACNASKEFDEGFRALMEECFPEGQLKELESQHVIFRNPRQIAKPPKIEVIKFKEKIGVIYLPHAVACEWHHNQAGSKPAFDLGVNIVFFVLKQAGRLAAGEKPIRD